MCYFSVATAPDGAPGFEGDWLIDCGMDCLTCCSIKAGMTSLLVPSFIARFGLLELDDELDHKLNRREKVIKLEWFDWLFDALNYDEENEGKSGAESYDDVSWGEL